MSDPRLPPTEQLIDVHAHFVTDSFVAAAKAAGHIHPDGMPDWPTWSVEAHLDLMDRNGIGTSILSMSSPGTHLGDDDAARTLTREVNEYGAGLAHDHPGRFGHFASLQLPDVDGALTELEYALDHLGSHGVTFETNAHGAYLGDKRYEPLWAELNRRSAVVFVHPTSPPCADEISLGRPRPMLEFIFDTTRTVSDLVFNGVFTRYPDIQWVFTHGGGALPLIADRMEMVRGFQVPRSPVTGKPEGIPVPTQLSELWFDIAGSPFPNQVPALVKAFGSERVLYGSDYCWTPAAGASAQIASVDAAAQPDGDTWRALTTRNAKRLFVGLDDQVSPDPS